MTESEEIDDILRLTLDDKPIRRLTTQELLTFRNALRRMKAYGLIESEEGIVKLTQMGYEVHEAGGFDKWRTDNKKRSDEAHQATLDTTRATVDAAQSAKQSKYVAIVSILVSVVLFGISYFRDNQIGDRINVIERRVDALSVLMKARLLEEPKSRLPNKHSVTFDSSSRQTVPKSASLGSRNTARRRSGILNKRGRR